MRSILVALVGILLLVNSAYAHMEIASVEDVMNSMMKNQAITDVKQLDCSKISNLEFESLGDAVMEKMAGSHELHEQMDAMMGGESSESLRQMHIVMGQNWLNCGVQGMMATGGMMGGYMMPMMMRMMGNYYPGYYNRYDSTLIFGIVGWVLFIVSLVVLILVFTGTVKIRKR